MRLGTGSPAQVVVTVAVRKLGSWVLLSFKTLLVFFWFSKVVYKEVWVVRLGFNFPTNVWGVKLEAFLGRLHSEDLKWKSITF